MIVGNIAKRLSGLDPRLMEVLEWLEGLDEHIPVGTYPLCGEQGRAVVVETTTLPSEKKLFEAHRQYIDIHYDLQGGETIECAPLQRLTETVPYSPEDDAVLLTGECETKRVIMGEGDICFLFPEDGHKPCCALDNHRIKKVIVKIPVDWMTSEMVIFG